MKANTEPLLPDTFYHIYNRGINGEDIFKSENSYSLFLEKYIFHIEPVARTFAYCLLKNHFHLLIQIKSESDIRAGAEISFPGKTINSIPHFLSNQFAHLFNGYTQVINATFDRTGALFESPFRRISVDNKSYFSQLVHYIHSNPEKHGLVQDFQDYPHSSYHSHLVNNPTRLIREEVLGWFGGIDGFQKIHRNRIDERMLKDFIIEF